MILLYSIDHPSADTKIPFAAVVWCGGRSPLKKAQMAEAIPETAGAGPFASSEHAGMGSGSWPLESSWGAGTLAFAFSQGLIHLCSQRARWTVGRCTIQT
jgi:hypothetical protein